MVYIYKIFQNTNDFLEYKYLKVMIFYTVYSFSNRVFHLVDIIKIAHVTVLCNVSHLNRIIIREIHKDPNTVNVCPNQGP